MNRETLNVKIDPKLKQELREFAAELGIPMSSLINGAIKQILRDRRITFDLELGRLDSLVEK